MDGTGSAAFRLHFYNLYFLVKQILPALVCPSIYVFGITDDGVMGYIADTSEKAYATCAAAVLPSMVLIFFFYPFVNTPFNFFKAFT